MMLNAYPKIDIGSQFGAMNAGIHGLVTIVVISGCEKLFPEIIDSSMLFVESNIVKQKG